MAGRSRIVPIRGGFHVWTRKVGDSPIKMLLLHGGPGCTHEYLEIFEQYLPTMRPWNTGNCWLNTFTTSIFAG